MTEYPLPDPFSKPTGITLGPDGALWFTESATSQIGRITTQGVVTEFSDGIPTGANPTAITLGSDGNLWFTETVQNVDIPVAIGRITPQGVVTQFTQGIVDYAPTSITSGPDGDLWFVDNGDTIGRITTNGVATVIPATDLTGISSITAGPDGDLWFTQQGSNQIGKLDPTTLKVTLYSDPSIDLPNAIAPGPDGALYFTSTRTIASHTQSNEIEKITTAGVVTPFPNAIATNSLLGGIAAVLTATCTSSRPAATGSARSSCPRRASHPWPLSRSHLTPGDDLQRHRRELHGSLHDPLGNEFRRRHQLGR